MGLNVGDLRKQDLILPTFQISIESEEDEGSNEHWQKQCCLLYNTINRNLMEGSIEPLSCESKKGERAGIITIFSTLLASGLSVKTFEQVFELIRVWLDCRPKAKVLMKFPNGNMIEISGVSGFTKSEVLSLFEKSLQTNEI